MLFEKSSLNIDAAVRGGGPAMERATKSFPVFDCDAHINDPTQIWDYVPDSKRELVRNTYWRGGSEGGVHRHQPGVGGGNGAFPPPYNPICTPGPPVDKKNNRELPAAG